MRIRWRLALYGVAVTGAAMLGLLVALVGIALSVEFELPALDGIASIIIGLVLAGTAALLAFESKGLLIGESADPAVVRRWLGERLPAAGWQVGAIGDQLVRASKGGLAADYRLIDLAPGTRIRLEYTAQP